MVASIQEVARDRGRPAAAPLDRGRLRRRARDDPRPPASPRRRADPRLPPRDPGARRRAEHVGRAGGRDRSAADGDLGGHGAGLFAPRAPPRPFATSTRSAARRIAFVNGPTHTVSGSSRRRGYLDGLRSCGLPRDEELIEVADDFMVEPGRRAAELLLARAQPDAILCANDLLAVGVLAALRDCRARRPGRRRARRDGQQRPLGADLAGADHRRPRLLRACAARGHAPARTDRAAGPRACRSSGSSRASSSAPRPERRREHRQRGRPLPGPPPAQPRRRRALRPRGDAAADPGVAARS